MGLVARRQTEHEDILSEGVQEETAGRNAQNTEEDRIGGLAHPEPGSCVS